MSRPPSHISTPGPQARAPLALDLLLIAACALAFLPGFSAGFSDFDDHGFLLEPTFWRGLSPTHLAAIFSTFHLGHYQPLTYLSYAIEHTLFGLNPAAFHTTNILLHAAAAIILRRVAHRLISIASPNLPAHAVSLGALAAALLWAVHPLRVESVVWITERRDVLSGLFLLAATLAYLNAVQPGQSALNNPRAYRWCIALLTLSLLSKAWGITFVAVAVILDIFPLARLPLRPWLWLHTQHRAALLQKLPLLALAVVFGITAAAAQRAASDETLRSLGEWGITERICQSAYGLLFYLRRTLLPIDLAALYELPATARLAEPRFFTAILAVAAATLSLAWTLAKKTRTGLALAAPLAAYAVILSPVLGLTQSGIQLVADRYSYIALMPLMILAGGALASFVSARLAPRNASILVALLTIACITQSFRLSTAWRDTRTLWERAFAAGQDGPVLRNYFARQLEKAKDFAGAETEYNKSLALAPNYGDSWFGLANAQRAQRKTDAALATYARAAELMNDPTPAFLARGLVQASDLNRPDLAVPEFAAAVKSLEARNNPARTGSPYLLLAAAYGAAGDDARAAEWLKKAREFSDTRAQAEEHLRDMGLLR